MNLKRPLRHEALENRRLLAANLEGFFTADQLAAVKDDARRLVSIVEDSGLLREVAQQFVPMDVEILHPIISRPLIYPGLSHGPDLVQEVGNRVFVVDQDPYGAEHGSLLIFQRGAEGGLELLHEVKVERHVDQLFVHDDQAVLIANRFDYRILAEAGEKLLDVAVPELDFAPKPIPYPYQYPGQYPGLAVTVSLGDTVEVVRQALPGLSHTIHQNGGELVVVSSIDAPIYPPMDPNTVVVQPREWSSLVTTYQMTGEGLKETASTKIPLLGRSVAMGDDFYVASTKPSDIVFFDQTTLTDVASTSDVASTGDVPIVPPEEPVPPTVSVSRYFLGDDGIGEVESVELGLGFLNHFEVADDGLTGVAVFHQWNRSGGNTTVALLNFAGGGIEVFQTIGLDGVQGHVLAGGPDYVVLRSWQENALVIVDADQRIDPAAENRIRKVALPDGVFVDYASLRLGDQLVLRGRRVPTPEPVPDDPTGLPAEGERSPLSIAPDREGESVLLLVSLPDATINEQSLPAGEQAVAYEDFFLIDAETNRFGFVVRSTPDVSLLDDSLLDDSLLDISLLNADRVDGFRGDLGLSFLYGRLTDSGDFQTDGAIPIENWLEVDANADRLLVRLHDRLLQYDWDQPGEPKVISLPVNLPPIEAVSDEYRLRDNGEDHLLRVLANDLVHQRRDLPRVEIIELIGAPEGTEIVEGRAIRIPAAALQGVDGLRFEYVISDGEQQSQAVVEINVLAISETQIEELVQAVRQRAAEDFDVPIDEVQVRSVERIFDHSLPVVRADDPVHLDLAPGILVIVDVPNATALYAASLEGRIVQAFVWKREFLAELSLVAVDANGERLTEIREGDEFFLQFRGKDLRSAGQGVYAAFFDLEVPTEHLELTDQVEYAIGFGAVRGGEVTTGMIDELGAIGTQIDAPGGRSHELLRVGVRAIAAGHVRLRPNPADLQGHETLLRGRDDEVPHDRVRYLTTELEILPAVEEDRLDANGDGDVSARDALVVINFLGRYGSMKLDDLPGVLGATRQEGEAVNSSSVDAMMRYDTNGSGTISAIDALVIINRLSDQATVTAASEEDGIELIGSEPAPIQGIEKATKI